MALTLTQGNMYSTTTLDRLITDLLTKDSKVMDRLPFEDILGNSLTYDVVVTDAGAQFYSVGDTWVESTLVLEQDTASLVVLGGDADVDNFLLATRSNHTDLKGTVIANKVKAVQNKYLDTFYYGDITTNSKAFNGVQELLTSTTYNTVHAGSTTGTALSINKLREAVDLITGIKPDGMYMSKQMRRYISVYLDSVGANFQRGEDKFGANVEMIDSIPVYTDDHIVNTEVAASGAYTVPTGGANTTIFILSFNSMGTCGISGGGRIKTEPLGNLETKDAQRWRIKFYCGLKQQNLRYSAKVDGIVAAGTVTA